MAWLAECERSERFAGTNPELSDADILPESHFRFGGLGATLRTNDAEFNSRFLRIFGDCAQPARCDDSTPHASLQIVSSLPSNRVFAKIGPDHDAFDATALAVVSPELWPLPLPSSASPQWQAFSRSSCSDRVMLAARADHLVFDRQAPWQSTLAHYFLHHVMRLQRSILFFHSASIAIKNRGVLISGAKGAGKSTLSLALTARGHDFLGDEIAAIDGDSGWMLPFPRSVSIRHGPQSRVVSEYLASQPVDQEMLPDGTQRMRMPVSRIFPASSPRRVGLTHAFFLAERGRRPNATHFDFSHRHMPLLAPLHATVARMPAGERTIKFLKTFSQVQCHLLSPGGTPDDTAQLINNIVET